MSQGSAPERRRARRGMPSAWRRGLLVAVLGGLVVGNAWLIRRQFPPDEQRKAEAIESGLDLFNRHRDFAKAEIAFRRALEVGDDPRVRLLLAQTLQWQGKFADARREFLAVLERNAEDDHARLGLAEIAQREQDYDQAFQFLAAAEAEDPTPIEAYLTHAAIFSEVGDIDGAIAVYRKALGRDPSCYQAHLAIADLLSLRGVLSGRDVDRLSAAGSYREAELLVKSQLSRGDDRRQRFALARAIAGQVATLKDRDLAEAARQLGEVAKADTTDPEPTLLLGQFLHAAKNDVEARRAFEDAATRWPRSDTAIALHDFYAETNEPALATKTLEDAISRDRQDLALRVRLVAWHVLGGRMVEAERELANAETILSEDWRVREVRGDLSRVRARMAAAEGRKDDATAERAKALAAYRLALEGRPRSPRLKKKIAEQLVEAMFGRKPGSAPTPDEEFARTCIEDVLRVNKTDAEALEWQARLLLAEGRAREAADALRSQLDAAQPSIVSLRLLGLSAMRVGDDRTAAAALLRVLDLTAPRDANERRDGRSAPPDDWCNAAYACIRAGMLDEASRTIRDGLGGWPESPRVAAAAGAVALARADATGAMTLLTDARARFPADGEIRLLFARALEESGRVDDAGRELEAAVTEIGSDEVRLRYLDFLARTGRLENAEQGFLGMIAADPQNPVAHVRLGDFYLAAKPPKRDAALREYETARDLDAQNPEPWVRIADLRMQEAKDDPQAFARAEEAAQRFESLAPNDPRVDYVRGKIALLSGRTDEALPLLAKYAEAEPDRAAGQYYLALALQAAGRLGDALQPLERATRLAPSDPAMRLALARLHYDLGLKSFEAGDFEAARQLFARADAGGAGRGSRFLLAGAAANAGKFDVSEAECRKLLETEPGNHSCAHLLATLLMQKGTKEGLDEAEGIFRRTLQAQPDDLFAQLALCTVKFARGMYRDALDDFRRIYPRTKSSPDVALAICQCYGAAGDAKGAVEFLEAESAANPTAWDFPHLCGDFLVQLKQPEDAVRWYLEAAKRAPDNPGPVLAAASALGLANQLEEARKLLVERQATSKEPALFAVALGDVLAHLGRVDEAQDQLRRALALAPGHPRALYLLGRIAETAGRGPEARKLYREAIDRGTVEADCHARLARILTADRDFAAARESWLRAVQFAPRDVTYLNNLALVTAEDDKRLAEAVGYARTAAALAPERGDVADTCGWLLYRSGNAREAGALLARAATLLGDVAIVQFHAGMALSKDGRLPEARVALERALALDAKFEGADTARAELDRIR